MELTDEQLIAVVLTLVSGILILFRRSDKITGYQFDNMKLRQEHTEGMLNKCEKNHEATQANEKVTNDRLFELSGKLEHELGKRAGAEEIADKIIVHIDKQMEARQR